MSRRKLCSATDIFSMQIQGWIRNELIWHFARNNVKLVTRFFFISPSRFKKYKPWKLLTFLQCLMGKSRKSNLKSLSEALKLTAEKKFWAESFSL